MDDGCLDGMALVHEVTEPALRQSQLRQGTEGVCMHHGVE